MRKCHKDIEKEKEREKERRREGERAAPVVDQAHERQVQVGEAKVEVIHQPFQLVVRDLQQTHQKRPSPPLLPPSHTPSSSHAPSSSHTLSPFPLFLPSVLHCPTPRTRPTRRSRT